jgi:uncharacterized protein (DUF1778 family)
MRNPQIGMRLTAEQLEKIKAAATKSRRTLSDFVRLVALDEAEKILTSEEGKAPWAL